MPIKKPAVRASYHHGNLRDVLVATGLKVIEKQGLDALTLREIGIQAGVSRTAAYRHFKGKDDLLCAISEAGFALFATELDAAIRNATPDFSSRVKAMGIAYVRFATRHRARYAAMFHAALNPTLDRAEWGGESARAFGLLEDVIRDGQAAGEARTGDTTLLARVVWSHIHGISTLRLAVTAGGELDEAFLNQTSDVLLGGMARPKAPSPVPRKRRKP